MNELNGFKIGDEVIINRVDTPGNSQYFVYAHGRKGKIIEIRTDGPYKLQPYCVSFSKYDSLWCHDISLINDLPEELFRI